MVRRLEDLDFADDLVLLFHQIKDIREKTNKLSEIGKKIWLNINSKKTKAMKVKTRKSGPITIEGEELEEVEKFIYLRSIISRTGGSDEDINARISKARQAFAMLKPVWSSTTLNESTKIRIFNINVKSVLLYGCETWRLTTGLQQKSRFLPTNAFDTYRKPQNNITREALDWNPQGQRKQGRPLHSWKRTRLKELRNIGKTWNEAKRTAQNRVTLRATVVAMCSTRNEED
nr:uncharacterized protein LOC117692963 [Crassostrea gigas]